MIYLREANEQDIDLIFQWANDPVVRQNSFNTEPIPYETHLKWFEKTISSDSIRLYIIMADSNAVGQIRLNIYGDEAEISYSIAAAFRGMGYGRASLRLIIETARRDLPELTRLTARVKPDNVRSNALFTDEGYNIDYVCYSYDISKKQNEA